MAEAAPAGTRGECQEISKASTRCRWPLTWGRLKQYRIKPGTRYSKEIVPRTPAGEEKNFSSPPFLLEKKKGKLKTKEGKEMSET